MALLDDVQLFAPKPKHDPNTDTGRFRRPTPIRPRPPANGRPDPGPLSLPRRVAVMGMFLLGLLAAIFVLGISVWEMTVWVPRCLDDIDYGGVACVRMFLVIVGFCYAVRWIMLIHYSIMEFLDEQITPLQAPEQWPFVSVVIPAYNEEQFIAMTIQSALTIDYPNYEVIIVDDGSTDNTLAIARRFEGVYEFGPVRVLTKPNGGKWTAHNFAFRQVRGEFILCTDADSRLDAQCMRAGILRLLSDPKADGVAGYTRVMQRHNWLLGMQALEFVIWNGALRIPQGRFGAVSCIPGPMGLFRKAALANVYEHFGKLPQPQKPGVYDGPFEHDTFAEDFDLTVAMQLLGGKVLYDPLAACDADCPTTMFDLLNQRYRWSRGSLQVLRKIYRRCVDVPLFRRPALLTWLILSYVYDVAVFVFAFTAQIVLTMAVLSGAHGDWLWFLFYFAVAAGFKFIISIPYLLLHRENLGLSLLVPFFDLYGTYILGGALLISMVDEARNNKMKW